MSQNKSKLLNKFLKLTGLAQLGSIWRDNDNRQHVLRESNRIKKEYREASHIEKKNLTVKMKDQIKNLPKKDETKTNQTRGHKIK